MAVNHGKLKLEPFQHEGQTYGRPVHVKSGQPWKDVVKQQAGHWFIAVDNGLIISAERDPMQSLIPGPDIWEIDHPGPAEALRGKVWDGNKVREA